MRCKNISIAVLLFTALLFSIAVGGNKNTTQKNTKNQTTEQGKSTVRKVRKGGSIKIPPPANSRITCDNPYFDFGEVPPSCNVEHSFWIWNKGTDTLKIYYVRSS